MKHQQTVIIRVNGKNVRTTVEINAPELTSEDCVSPSMIFSAVANGQNMKFASRHHKDRQAIIEVRPQVDMIEAPQQRTALRRVV